jgi:arylformamidase
MGLLWHDVSIPLSPDTVVWPGDPPFQMEVDSRIAAGNSCNTSILRLGTHCGTHCDAPWHFEDTGKTLDAVDSQRFFGEALLIDLPDVDRIEAADLGPAPLPPRVLFKTRNSDLGVDTPFREDFVALSPGAAERLVHDGVRLAGIDGLSIAPFGASGPTHHILLQNEIFVVEGLRLAGFAPGCYPFVVLPLPVTGADGAPCRAFLGVRA